MSGSWTPDFWLATGRYTDAPEKAHRKVNLETEPPIAENWKSPSTGRRVEDASEWLQEKPESVDLDSHHFAILDAQGIQGWQCYGLQDCGSTP